MKRLMIAIIIATTGLFFSTQALAATQYARSVVYLDAHDNIIGQSVLFCNNKHLDGGNVNQSNANEVTSTFGCGVSPHCGPRSCAPPEFGEIAIYIHSATGATVQEYCNIKEGTGGPFAGRPPCGFGAPSLVVGRNFNFH